MSRFFFDYHMSLRTLPDKALKPEYYRQSMIRFVSEDHEQYVHMVLMSVQNELEYRNIKY